MQLTMPAMVYRRKMGIPGQLRSKLMGAQG
jgi:hypothetical protein